jgi:hypothetical protein
MATNAQGLRPIPWVHYGFTLTDGGTRLAVIARAQYVDRDDIEWGYCFSANDPKGVFRAIPPVVTHLDPDVGEEAIRLIANGLAVPSALFAQLRELPRTLWEVTRSLRV